MAQPGRILIYGLLDPAEAELFYVGQTRKRREFRLLEHIEAAVSGSALPVHEYIRTLVAKGRIPSIMVLERVVDASIASQVEVKWIQHLANCPQNEFPIVIPPQTRLSEETVIRCARLQNVTHNPAMRR